MSLKPVFLDSNIFMYAAGKPHPHKEPCLRILRDVELRKLSAAINSEILQELLYRYSYISLAEKGIELCRQVLEYPLAILPVSETDMRRAVDIFESFRATGLRARDAVHAATMQEHELSMIVSADKHFDHVEGIERLDPADYVSGKTPVPGEAGSEPGTSAETPPEAH